MKPWTKYVIAVAVAALMVFGLLYIYDVQTAETTTQTMRILANSFTVPGALFLLFSALLWVGSSGAMDGISYALGRAVRMLIPFSRKDHETFYDYKTRKAEARSGSSFRFLTFVGLGFFAVGVLFTVLFYVV